MTAIFPASAAGLHQDYRKDIDGLRALAIIAVVLYHAFPRVLPGGFVGVDVFFVISGFLISTGIIENLQHHRFGFADFYARRVRRIFPALVVVLCFTALSGWLILLPDEFERLGTHLAASAGFSQNLILWSEAGYFDPASESKPLLHLWSLGIEEQFYILWPLLLWAAWRAKVRLTSLALVLGGASLIWNVMSVGQDPVGTFYGLHTRMWELLSGGLLAALRLSQPVGAVASRFGKPGLADLSSLAGMALVLFSMAAIKDTWNFPGIWAVFPVAGTALIIAAGPQSIGNRYVFSSPAAVFVGLISYPLYLWHWVLMSFATIIKGASPDTFTKLGVIAASVICAILTFQFVERPLRHGRLARKTVVTLMSALMISLFIAGLLAANGYVSNGVVTKYTDEAAFKEARPGYEANCESVFPDWSKTTDQSCLFQKASGNTIAIVGDSHAGQLFPGLSQAVPPEDGVAAFPASCAAPFLRLSTGLKALRHAEVRINNFRLVEDAFNYIVREPDFDIILLSHSPSCSFRDARDLENPDSTDYKKNLARAMRRTFSFLTAHGKNVIYVLDNPRLPFEPGSCLRWPWGPARDGGACSFPRSKARYARWNKEYAKILKKVLKEFPAVALVDLSAELCEGKQCHVTRDGRLLYSDIGHLSVYGSGVVAKDILEAIARIRSRGATPQPPGGTR